MSSHWSEADFAVALEMLERREHPSAFLRRFGRTKKSVESRRDRIKYGSPARVYAKKRSPSFHEGSLAVDRFAVPADALMEARRRAMAPRSLTAWICGDPAPGSSALDRRAST